MAQFTKQHTYTLNINGMAYSKYWEMFADPTQMAARTNQQ